MGTITIEGADGTNQVLDIEALGRKFAHLSDQRFARGIRYSLPILLVLILLARLAGETTPYGISQWLKYRSSQLVSIFNLKSGRTPSTNTIRRTLSDTILVGELQQATIQFLHEAYGNRKGEQVVIDGKTMRGTIPKGQTKGVHLLSAFMPQEEIVLDQIEVETKENELSALPRLLSKLDLKGKFISGDAMFTQRNLSVEIGASGGDYLWFVKENQLTLLQDVEQFFVPPRKKAGWHIPTPKFDEAESLNVGHGRIEKRRIQVAQDDTGFIDWPNLKQVFKIERTVTHVAKKKTTHEVAFGITSLDSMQQSASQLLDSIRSHWGIENKLHYRRDVTLKEDDVRMSCSTQAEAVAIFNNFIVCLSKRLGFDSLAEAIRCFAAQIDLNLAMLSFCT